MPSKPKDVGVSYEIKGLNQLLRTLNKLPKDLQGEIRDASTEIASSLKAGAQSAAHTPLEELVAAGLKVKRDRIPVLRSGTQKVGHRATPMQHIFYGAEFGGRRRPTTQQFQPHQGRRGYFLYPTARAQGRRNAERWAEAVDKAFKQWDHKE